MRPLLRWIPVLLLMASAVSCTSNESLSSTKWPKGTVTHVVVMWLYDRGDETARREVLAAGRKLEQIPGVLSVHGGHVLQTERPNADNSFDVAFVLNFATEEDLNRFVTNPIHVETRKNTLDRYVKTYKTYDFMAE